MATRMSDEEAKQRREAAHRRREAEQAAKQSVAQAVKEKIASNPEKIPPGDGHQERHKHKAHVVQDNV